MIQGLPFDVSRETFDRLNALEALVQKWSPKINLVSKRDLPTVFERHIRDSLQLWGHVQPGKTWVDIGSGGGFPALPIAIMAKQDKPDTAITCIESDQRKCTFLRTAARELDLNVTVLTQRIEEAPAQSTHTLSARALDSLSNLLIHAERHLDADGTCLFMKGASWKEEIAEAQEIWAFQVEAIPSITSENSRLLKCREIRRA